MNEERLYINGQELKLKPSTQLAYTLQVNDIASVESRQASFTRTISIPKCPENNQIMNFLGVAGNQSNLPYEKNKINYYVGNDCIIYEGWGVITETIGDEYKLHIYDGVIDLFKAIENKTLAELDVIEIDHEKTLSAVTTTWSTDLPYKYIVADYNGKIKYDNATKFNIDYLVPSVRVNYLWDKIFDTYGISYEGSIFSSDTFSNLWMTYPKGVQGLGEETVKYQNDNVRYEARASTYSGIHALYQYVDGTPSINNLYSNTNKHFKVAETGTYQIEITGEISPTGNDGGLSGVRCDIWIAKNSSTITNANDVTDLTLLLQNIGGDYTQYYDCTSSKVVGLNALDTIALVIRENDGKNLRYVTEKSSNPLKFTIKKVAGADVSFSQTLIDFKIKDFISEITNRFSLTIFKEKYSNHYKFVTLDERIRKSERIDWSNKFQYVKSEKYIYGDYAQKNIFRHKYNDENSQYFDGYIDIPNVNLSDEKKLLDSKIFVPEKNKNTVDFPFETNIYKLWNKEVNENDGVQEVTYKELDKRFYFLKDTDYTFLSATTFGSELLDEFQSVSNIPVENFSGLTYNETIENYYSDFTDLLGKSKIINAVFNLSSTDIATFDFNKLYYIEQLGSYFLINKINNWTPNNLTDVEIIKLENVPLQDNEIISTGTTPTDYITITGQTITNADAWTRTINIFFETNITTPYLQAVINDSSPVTILNSSPFSLLDIINQLGGTTTFKLQSMDGTVISNTTSWWG